MLFLRFLFTGGVAAVVNLVARYLFNFFMPFAWAVLLAFPLGVATAYVLARRLVFSASGRSVASELWRFTLVNLVALGFVWGISVGLAYVVFPAIHFTWHAEDVAHVIGVLAPAVISFVGHRHFSFRKLEAKT